MCKNNGKRKSRVASIDCRGTKVYSKLKSGNQLVPIGEDILYHNWIKIFSYKKSKISPSKCLITYEYNSDSHKESETLNPLTKFIRITYI